MADSTGADLIATARQLAPAIRAARDEVERDGVRPGAAPSAAGSRVVVGVPATPEPRRGGTDAGPVAQLLPRRDGSDRDGDNRMRQSSSWLNRNLSRAALAWLIAIAAAPVSGQAAWTPEALSGLHYKAVLIAGDQSATAFDHATAAMRDRLLGRGVAAADIQRLSASPGADARLSTLPNVLAAIEHMHPAAGEGCLVFATSHGAWQDGLVLAASENFLTPAALDRALSRGCGGAPTVVIISGCFSGDFAKPPMARANRIVLTAAREDRPSFGCGAGFEFTVYDRCLLETMDRAGTWRAAYAMIRTCVAASEKEAHFPPSDPRAWFGADLTGMPLPRAP
jgi:hypothetical protein